MGKLQDKVVVVTGGNSGIGRASALRFKQEGAKVAIFGRNRGTLDEVAKELGEGTLVVQGDVAHLEDIDRLVAETGQAFGGIDVLFVNAGIAKVTPLVDYDESTYDAIFDVNVKGAFFTVQKAIPLLNEGASIILNASIAGQIGMPGMSAYSASKAAVRSLARSFSSELVERKIRVNTISPGPIETPLYGRMGLPGEQIDEFGQQIESQVPMQRFGSADEIAGAALFLASPDSSYVLGTDLVVDGGMSQL